MQGKKEKQGALTGLYLPAELYELSEEARKRLGMNRSRFYQYAITRLLQDLSLLTTKVHEKEGGADG